MKNLYKIFRKGLIWAFTFTVAAGAMYTIMGARLPLFTMQEPAYDFKERFTLESSQKLIQFLRNHRFAPRVNIYVNSYGGDVDSLLDIIYEFKQMKGKIIYHVGANAQSSAAVLACYADEVRGNPFAHFMFHPYQLSTGLGDRFALTESAASVRPLFTFYYKQQTQVLKACKKWLTAADLNAIFKEGKEVDLFLFQMQKRESKID